MNLNKLWLGLGITALLVAAAVYFDQVIRLRETWDWTQFLTHEAAVGIAGGVGTALLIVALPQRVSGKKINLSLRDVLKRSGRRSKLTR